MNKNRHFHPAEPLGELIRCFDDQGEEIESHTRMEVHAQPLKYWHAVTGVIVVNPKGQILASKRSKHLTQRPGAWQTNFGGHVNAGETYEQNAVRELGEEAGIKVRDGDLFYLAEIRNEEYKHIAKIFVILFVGKLSKLVFNDGEVTEVKWVDMAQAWREKLNNPEKWGSACPPERQEQIKLWLKKIS